MTDPEAFLKQEIESASPAKLRWLLIRKALGLAEVVGELWAEGKVSEAAQWWIRIKDILSELLDGVTDPQNPAARTVSDLYIFLIRTAHELEKSHDPDELRAFLEILRIEQETWDIYHRRENQAQARHMHLEMAAEHENRIGVHQSDGISAESGFSFEA